MATINFSTGTIITSTWLNDVDALVWDVFNGATTAALARTALGLGTMATQAASAVAITGGSIAGITDLAVADGGTGSSTAAAAATALAVLPLAGGTMTGDITMTAASIIEAEGAAVASAATTNIWATDGNTIHITGTTTITSFGTAPQVGAWMKVIFDDALTLTHGANLSLPGSANITTAADDFAFVYADTTTQFDVIYFKKSGVATIVAAATSPITLGTPIATTSGTAHTFTGVATGTRILNFSLDGVSTGGTSNLLIQIGDSGGLETTGYVSGVKSDGVAMATSTAGFILTASFNAARPIRGVAYLSLLNSSTFTWAIHGVLEDGTDVNYFAGTKSLSAELDRISITTVSGDTFDAGSVNYLGVK